MKALTTVLIAAMLAGASCLYAASLEFTVIPNSACSWEDLSGATLFVSIDGEGGIDS